MFRKSEINLHRFSDGVLEIISNNVIYRQSRHKNMHIFYMENMLIDIFASLLNY